MAKKKLLNEAQVRRFMSLSGIQPINEMGYKMEEDEMEENIYEEDEMEENIYEEEKAEEPAPEMDAEPEMDAASEVEAGEEVTVTQDTIDAAGDALMDLLGQLNYKGAEGAAAPEMDAEPEMDAAPEMDAEEPEMDMGDEEAEEEEEVMEALSGVNLELNEDELVQEVARRVAKRILKAKKAQQQLDEALGNKKRRTSRK